MVNAVRDRGLLVKNWLSKAEAALTAADVDLAAGNKPLAVERLYYALFFMVTAGWTLRGEFVKKPSPGQHAFEQEFIPKGALSDGFCRLISSLTERWHIGDTVSGKETVILFGYLVEARELLNIMQRFSQDRAALRRLAENKLS
ncbi:MAG: HEPN domain-containing protein [Solirubrobacterales bacterium]